MSKSETGVARPGLVAGFIKRGLIVTIVAIALKLAAELAPIGHWADYQTFVWLAQSDRFRPDPGIVVADIGQLPGGEKDPVTGKIIPTPRIPLQEIVRAIAAAGARGVMVDIDMSPNQDGWLTPGDPAFLEEMLRVNASVPVRLGVYRTLMDSDDAWLGQHRYASLAAGVFLPTGEARRVPFAFYPEEAHGRALPSLAAAVVRSPRSSWRDFIASRSHSEEVQITSDMSIRSDIGPIDYSVIPQLKRETLPVAGAEDVRKLRDKLKNQLVFVGSTQGGRDSFAVPGDTESQAGIYIHAAAAYTLDKAPLWDAKFGSRLAADFALSLLALYGFVLAGVHRENSPEARRIAQGRIILAVVALIVMLGLATIHYARIFWTDFFLACLFLALHPGMERFAERFSVFRRFGFGEHHA